MSARAARAKVSAAGAGQDRPGDKSDGGLLLTSDRQLPLHPEGTVVVVVAGPSGVGKSTVAAALAARLGWVFAEGDDFHDPLQVAAMAAGHPLSDQDRWPWLQRLSAWIGAQEAAGSDAVLTCSALKRPYRELLSAGHPAVRFVQLYAPAEVLGARVRRRHGHFMPAALVPSQLRDLQPLEPDEPGVRLAATGRPEQVAERIVSALGLRPRV